MKIFKNQNAKRALLFFALLLAVASFSFASDDFGLNSKVASLVILLNNPWVKGIAFVALVIECIAMITAGRQEPGMFKKFVPWIAGTIVFMAAPTITAKFLDLSSASEKDALTKLGLPEPK